MKSIGKLRLAGTFAACVISHVACAAQSATDPAKLLEEPVSPAIKLSYGSNALQFGELRLPPGDGPFPLVIMIHGGCWERQLAPEVPEAITSFHLLSPAATSLTADGYATWNIEYRRVGRCPMLRNPRCTGRCRLVVPVSGGRYDVIGRVLRDDRCRLS